MLLKSLITMGLSLIRFCLGILTKVHRATTPTINCGSAAVCGSLHPPERTKERPRPTSANPSAVHADMVRSDSASALRASVSHVLLAAICLAGSAISIDAVRTTKGTTATSSRGGADPLDLVDLYIGTGGDGFGVGGSPPGAQLPFGMVRASPDTCDAIGVALRWGLITRRGTQCCCCIACVVTSPLLTSQWRHMNDVMC